MVKQFDYRVCQIQQSRITFVNGEWAGTVPLSPYDSETAFQSCPQMWDYLQDVGEEGWELVSSLNPSFGESQFQLLFLKRQIGG